MLEFLKIDYSSETVSGLALPVVTVSQFSDSRPKKTIMATGRLHPGQPQGSWMVHGLLRFLCSPDAAQLRNLIIFKIIPMVNIDGVVLGNFRAGIKGLDMNRLFKTHSFTSSDQGIQRHEVDFIRGAVDSSKQKILMYLDFHGHSTKKNIFVYGPDYKMGETDYFVARLFPKTISNQTQMFRYYSCLFKVSKSKEATVRAMMLREKGVPYVYTVEASTHGYWSQSMGEVVFTAKHYEHMGKVIGQSQKTVIRVLLMVQMKKLQMAKIMEEKAILRRQKSHELDQDTESTIRASRQVMKMRKKKSRKVVSEHRVKNSNRTNIKFQMIQELFAGDQSILKAINQINNQEEDMFEVGSEGQSDCESQSQDFKIQELQAFFSQDKKKKHKKQGRSIDEKDMFKAKRTIEPVGVPIRQQSVLVQKRPRQFKTIEPRDAPSRPSPSLGNRSYILQSSLQKSGKQLVSPKKPNRSHLLIKDNKIKPVQLEEHTISPMALRSIVHQMPNKFMAQKRRNEKRIPEIKINGEFQDHNIQSHNLKLSTFESRTFDPEKISENIESPYNSGSRHSNALTRGGGIKEAPINSVNVDDLDEQKSTKLMNASNDSGVNPKKKKVQYFPQIVKREAIKVRKLEVLEGSFEIPDVITQILKKHVRNSDGRLVRRLNKSIQIIKL